MKYVPMKREHLTLGLALARRCGLKDGPFEAQLKRHAEFRADWMRGADEVDQDRRRHLMDLIKRSCELDKMEVPGDRGEAIRAAVSSGSVANIFTTSVNALLMQAYEEEVDTTALFCAERDVDNFKTIDSINFSGGASLKPLARGGTAQDAAPTDTKETYNIGRFARKFSVDEMDLIDDEVGALMTMPDDFGRAGRRLRPDMVYALMLRNPAMADTGTLFNATALTTTGGHANYAASASDVAGGPLSANTLQLALTAIAKQPAPDGSAANIRGKVVIVPPELKFTAMSLISSSQLIMSGGSNTTIMGNANVLLAEQLVMASDGRIGTVGVTDPNTGTAYTGTATNYFVSAAPGRGIEVAYRSGTNRAPVIRGYALDQGRWGLGWDIALDIGVKATDFRGLFKGKGAA